MCPHTRTQILAQASSTTSTCYHQSSFTHIRTHTLTMCPHTIHLPCIHTPRHHRLLQPAAINLHSPIYLHIHLPCIHTQTHTHIHANTRTGIIDYFDLLPLIIHGNALLSTPENKAQLKVRWLVGWLGVGLVVGCLFVYLFFISLLVCWSYHHLASPASPPPLTSPCILTPLPSDQSFGSPLQEMMRITDLHCDMSELVSSKTHTLSMYTITHTPS